MGIGQAEMARRLGRAPSPPDGAMISRYERGEREPNLFVILGYARLADIPVDLLLDDTLAVREVAWAMSKEVKKKR
jgi:transcriptional regulator with XRE-family HTH domain